MSVPNGPEKPESPSSTVVELARVVLHGGSQSPANSLRQLASRLASFCLRAAVLIILLRGSAGAPFASQLVILLGGLVAIVAVDEWLATPLRRGLGNLARFIAARRGGHDSLPKPSSQPQLNRRTDADPPDHIG